MKSYYCNIFSRITNTNCNADRACAGKREGERPNTNYFDFDDSSWNSLVTPSLYCNASGKIQSCFPYKVSSPYDSDEPCDESSNLEQTSSAGDLLHFAELDGKFYYCKNNVLGGSNINIEVEMKDEDNKAERTITLNTESGTPNYCMFACGADPACNGQTPDGEVCDEDCVPKVVVCPSPKRDIIFSVKPYKFFEEPKFKVIINLEVTGIDSMQFTFDINYPDGTVYSGGAMWDAPMGIERVESTDWPSVGSVITINDPMTNTCQDRCVVDNVGGCS